LARHNRWREVRDIDLIPSPAISRFACSLSGDNPEIRNIPTAPGDHQVFQWIAFQQMPGMFHPNAPDPDASHKPVAGPTF
jgi:hypothetical protein